MTQTRWKDDEAIAFAATLESVPGDLVTWCRGWTAHDLLAHAVAGGAEIARLVGRHLGGETPGATIAFEEREPAFRALPYGDLVELVRAGGILDLLGSMADDETATVEFTGWPMSAETLALHVRSELAIHRWDIAGSDDTSMELLSQPELTAHAVRALSNFGVIAEGNDARTRAFLDSGLTSLDLRLRVDGRPDVAIAVSAEATELRLADPDGSPAIVTDAAGRLLMLWGRQPPQQHRATTDLDSRALAVLQRWLYR